MMAKYFLDYENVASKNTINVMLVLFLNNVNFDF